LHRLKAKAEEVPLTRPDLILQPDQPVRSGLVIMPCGGKSDILTLRLNGHSNFPATSPVAAF
jgi:hypothetical protein